ncbi:MULTISPECIES: UDP-N-acetylglucosamine 1-carboxyvinyltransferase [unclassified Thermosynechococcus]|uniref:UDP-N-acetylglucosamine 1-carboxyvinyltransferase n=1 Tax=unclassified Thermosynechococcus TaxID=2622553 RepID=UPI0019F3A642|nr:MULTISPECIES: UDP-N-acetylglucosamine 1-carboxyvinyltransferase [unclassified Thermosynechococcus]HIK34826.1 UDP-N-acetylglucosamine 1-carboxyvinyltransferase [Thermosynechococcus sp. M98_K2018_005]HIK47704.1 UDP-N-acetylglucosamine 1-carboxyvinyltransferase [Thermosynechococcus sp. M55_K2018_012]
MLTSTTMPLTTEQAHLKIQGGYRLSGEVRISGAKNSALVLMAGALLAADTTILHAVPDLADIRRLGEILQALGVKVQRLGSEAIAIDATDLNTNDPPYRLVSQLRASFFAIGPLVARLGVARVPLPGGCAIGARPVELHVRGLQAMGAEVTIDHGVVTARAAKLKGTRIYLDYPSVGATETLMMAATLAEGETTIENAAQEPEVVDLANCCIAMGAKIYGAGTNSITIVGVDRLHGTEYEIIPDRIEAGTFLLAAAVTRSAITLAPVIPSHLTPVIAKLAEMGATVEFPDPTRVRFTPAQRYRATDIETLPYPGFPTDMQALMMTLLAISEGNSLVSETVFENRFGHVAELNRMGADIRVKGNHAAIRGVPYLSGAPVTGTDLRATAALVVAGLAAHGETHVYGLQHLDRGYWQIEAKLRGLGAQLERYIPSAAPSPVF